MTTKERVAAVEGWFTLDGEPRLLGHRCAKCGTYFFPKNAGVPEPRLRRDGARRGGALEPGHGLVVHDQPLRAAGALRRRRAVRAVLARRGRAPRGEAGRARPGRSAASTPPTSMSGWRSSCRSTPCSRTTTTSTWCGSGTGSLGRCDRWVTREVAVLGVGMHPWGKWGRNFVEYGVVAARAALADAGVDVARHPVRLRCRHHPQRLPGLRRRRDVRAGARLAGRAGGQLATRRVRRARPRSTSPAPRSSPGCATSPSSSAPTPRRRASSRPTAGERPDDPDWLRFRLLGATNPTYFALYARRRMELYGATPSDFAKVKVKNAGHGLSNPNARYRKEVTADEVAGVADRGRPAAPARDLRHERRRRRGRAVEHRLRPGARTPANTVRVAAISHGHAVVSQHRHRDAELRHRLGRSRRPNPPTASATRSRSRRTPRPASAPTTSTSPRSTTSRPRSSSTGTRTSASAGPARPRSCCTTAPPPSAGRIPVNPSGGLACFGEAVPAQALAQVCEVTWQLRGQAGDRQVDGATVGLTINQGLFGHGSSVILVR